VKKLEEIIEINKSKIIDYINKHVILTEDEMKQFALALKEVKFKKRQFIIQPNFVAKHRYFILNGAVRAYVIGNEGQEYTVQLAIEDWWISDLNSYISQQPASMFVMAVEDTIALQISFEDEKALKADNHKFETFFRIMAERGTAFMQRRFISSITLSAIERYDLFIDRYPHLYNRFPQYVIASYLGMSTEFISKIRNQKTKRKS
jgi:CRP-like cAMP-binding protein